MKQPIEEFFHDFRQTILVSAEASSNYHLGEFSEFMANELMETGFIEGFEFCHYRAQRGMRVDGYWFTDEGVLDLFIADFDFSEQLLSLTKTDVNTLFKRVFKFFETCKNKELYKDLDETSPEYGLARQIFERKNSLRKVNLYLLSERALSDRVEAIPDHDLDGLSISHQIWDISRLYRQKSSLGQKEALDIDFQKLCNISIPCLPAHLSACDYESYLVVIPAATLSLLYEKYGARLLEQNVRCFLQARGNVNKGIRKTLIQEPHMFFAYNNGITATAQEVEVKHGAMGLEIVRIKDLQIVNGGQTTASIFHTQYKDKAPLQDVFVQMKLSVIQPQQSETVVPKISEYANTQNKVNAADFFSNHPYHVRMEEFSRRIWAPAQQGALRETKWFYERARGQYLDLQSQLTPSEKKKFQAEYLKPQMFTKTDLAKFENVWDENPRYVNLGAQKNFAQYAKRIGKEWEKSEPSFNELYFKRAVARAILFRHTEKLVSKQAWYDGGYRANVVAYTLALLGFYAKEKNKRIDFIRLWHEQRVPEDVHAALVVVAEIVFNDITRPAHGISNVTEWCKKEACWLRLQESVATLEQQLPPEFKNNLMSLDDQKCEAKTARKIQKTDSGIEAQTKVLKIPGFKWKVVFKHLLSKGSMTTSEQQVAHLALQMPKKIPTAKQSQILLTLHDRYEQDPCALSSEATTM